MIGHALAILALKAVTRLPKGLGLYPVGFHVRRSLASLRLDDLDAAMAFYEAAVARDFTDERVNVLREILTNEIRFRRKKLIESVGNAQARDRGLRVLDGFLTTLHRTGASGTAVPNPIDEP